MALEIRPNCEWCDKDLPATAPDACICSYECTFCASCVDTVLANVCPNCGGGFVPRPVRPTREWCPGVSLTLHPAGTQRRHSRHTPEEVAAHVARLRDTPPERR